MKMYYFKDLRDLTLNIQPILQIIGKMKLLL